MEEQLKAALELHEQGDLLKALQLYEKVLKVEQPPLVAFLNASSILRSEKKPGNQLIASKRNRFHPNEPNLNNLRCYLDANTLTLAIGNSQSFT